MPQIQRVTVAAALIFCFCQVDVWAQTKSTRTKSSRAKSSRSQSSSKSGSFKPRLPKYFTHLKLKEEQKEEIYSIQEKYRKKIEDLTKELAKLKEDQLEECEDVLTRTQKTLYNKYKAGTLKIGSKPSSSSPSSKSKTKSSSKSKSGKKSSSSSRKKS